jgi:hypothetical protein
MAHDDRIFLMVAGAVLTMALAAFILVGVAPSITGPRPQVADSSELEQRTSTPVRTAVARTGHAARPGAAVAAVNDEKTRQSHQSRGRLEWLSASFELGAVASGEPGVDSRVDRIVGIVDALARGTLPDGEPALSLPWDRVLVRDMSDGRMVLASGTFRYYDKWIALVAGLDVSQAHEALAELIDSTSGVARSTAIDPEAIEARAEEGLESGLKAVLRHLLEVEVPSTPAEMESHVTRWAFADDEHRRRSPVQKHLLLMGPDNARILQAKLAELEKVFGWDEPEGPNELEPAIDTDNERDRAPSGQPLLASNDLGMQDGEEAGAEGLITAE